MEEESDHRKTGNGRDQLDEESRSETIKMIENLCTNVLQICIESSSINKAIPMLQKHFEQIKNDFKKLDTEQQNSSDSEQNDVRGKILPLLDSISYRRPYSVDPEKADCIEDFQQMKSVDEELVFVAAFQISDDHPEQNCLCEEIVLKEVFAESGDSCVTDENFVDDDDDDDDDGSQRQVEPPNPLLMQDCQQNRMNVGRSVKQTVSNLSLPLAFRSNFILFKK